MTVRLAAEVIKDVAAACGKPVEAIVESHETFLSTDEGSYSVASIVGNDREVTCWAR